MSPAMASLDRSLSGVGLVDLVLGRTAKPGQLVLQLEFATLEFGKFSIVYRWMDCGILKFPLQRVMLALELNQVILKRHSVSPP